MMYRKATLFDDAHIAAKILQQPDPKKQKALGRKVSGFEGGKWDVWKEGIVEEVRFPPFFNPPLPLFFCPCFFGRFFLPVFFLPVVLFHPLLFSTLFFLSPSFFISLFFFFLYL